MVDQKTFRIPPPDAEDAVQIYTIPSSNQLTPPISPHDASFTSSGLSEVDLAPDTPNPCTGGTEATPQSFSERLSAIAYQSPLGILEEHPAPWSLSLYRWAEKAGSTGIEPTLAETPDMAMERIEPRHRRVTVETISDGASCVSDLSGLSDGEGYRDDEWFFDSTLVEIERGLQEVNLLGLTEVSSTTRLVDPSISADWGLYSQEDDQIDGKIKTADDTQLTQGLSKRGVETFIWST